MLSPSQFREYSENLFRRFPQEFLALGKPDLDNQFNCQRATRQAFEDGHGKTISITLSRAHSSSPASQSLHQFEPQRSPWALEEVKAPQPLFCQPLQPSPASQPSLPWQSPWLSSELFQPLPSAHSSTAYGHFLSEQPAVASSSLAPTQEAGVVASEPDDAREKQRPSSSSFEESVSSEEFVGSFAIPLVSASSPDRTISAPQAIATTRTLVAPTSASVQFHKITPESTPLLSPTSVASSVGSRFSGLSRGSRIAITPKSAKRGFLSSGSHTCDVPITPGTLQNIQELTPLEDGGSSNRGRTVIIYDWDDTLFPTTWLTKDKGLAWNVPCPTDEQYTKPLESLACRVKELLESSLCIADRVAIVTLATRPWVPTVVQNFFPSLTECLENIHLVYARDALEKDDAGEYDVENFKTAAEFWSAIKASAIAEQCKRAMSDRDDNEDCCVKPGMAGFFGANLISIGDSDFERLGTRKVSSHWIEENHLCAERLPRTKTIKMLEQPTAHELETQIILIASWIQQAVERDGCFNLDFHQIGAAVVGDIESVIMDAGWEFAPGEARSESLMQGRFWKPKSDANPMEEWHWIPRHMWLSRRGKLWYEGMVVRKPVEHFSGSSVRKMVVRPATEDEAVTQIQGRNVYPIAFSRTDNGKTYYLALETKRARSSFLAACRILVRFHFDSPKKKRTSNE